MIGYVTLGTNDMEKAAKFYDALAKEMGVGRMMDFDQFVAWGEMGGAPGIATTTVSMPAIFAIPMATSSTSFA